MPVPGRRGPSAWATVSMGAAWRGGEPAARPFGAPPGSDVRAADMIDFERPHRLPGRCTRRRRDRRPGVDPLPPQAFRRTGSSLRGRRTQGLRAQPSLAARHSKGQSWLSGLPAGPGEAAASLPSSLYRGFPPHLPPGLSCSAEPSQSHTGPFVGSRPLQSTHTRLSSDSQQP